MLKTGLKILWLITLFCTLTSGAFWINKYYKSKKNAEVQPISESLAEVQFKKTSDPITAVKPEPAQDIALNTVFFGDTFWSRYINNWSKQSSLKYAYPFSQLQTFEPEKYDAWIANLECPVTSTELSAGFEDANLKFSCSPNYLNEAKKWFKAFSIANNHTDNMQSVNGFEQTRNFLEQNGIQYFGHFDNSVTSDACEVVTLEGQFVNSKRDETAEKFPIPIALCGYNNAYKFPNLKNLEVIKSYSSLLPTIVMPHQGVEYDVKSNQYQQAYYKIMVDNGADAVLGAHPHVVQESEVYKDKLIVYSMGNFIFDQQVQPNVRHGIGVNVKMVFANDENLQSWIKLAPKCKEFKDNCLNKARSQKLTKPKVKFEFEIIATDSSNKKTKKASPEIYQEMLKRLNWSETLKKLKQI